MTERSGISDAEIEAAAKALAKAFSIELLDPKDIAKVALEAAAKVRDGREQGTLIERLRAKADEIDRSVARDKDDRDSGNFGEIELMREAADVLERLALGEKDQAR